MAINSFIDHFQDLAGRLFTKAVKAGFRLAFKTLFRARVRGLEHLKALEGKPVLVIANHVSYLDGVFLGVMLPFEMAFAIDKGVYDRMSKNPLVRFCFKQFKMYPIDSNNPQGVKEMTRLVKTNQPVLIFPEGRLTPTGNIMQVFDGAATIAHNADAIILPIYTEGFQFMPLGLSRTKHYPQRLFPKLTLNITEPQKLKETQAPSRKEQRKQQQRQLDEMMRTLPIAALDKKRSLMDALHYTKNHYGWKYQILDDVEARGVTYGDVLTGAYALGGALKKGTAEGENVGFLLPNSRGATIAFWALQAFGRIPAMLNLKAEATDMLSYTQTASLKTIVTSRRFVEMAKMEDKIKALETKCKIIYLEDLKDQIGTRQKLIALARAKGWLPRPKSQRKGQDSAVVLFTSGSEGPPKGVVLSSANLLSNMAQVSAIAPLTPSDKLFNAMPLFHSFGLCGGMVMPVLKGIRSFQYPTPLDGKNIPKALYFYDATILFGTNTFLNLYARNANNQDMTTLQHVYAGAEALTQDTYDMYFKRFGIQVHQGYGLTEASPVVALSVRGAHAPDSVGRILPGIETRLEPVEGVENGYRLYIRGPNIMMGYLKYDNPDVLEPPQEGWHDTGDIVTISPEGFVRIAGRAKRFAKIGGEMVALDTIEAFARAASKKADTDHAVILHQDKEAGDAVILFTTDPAIKRDAMTKAAQDMGKSALGIPKNADIEVLADMPKLATGKTDYVRLKRTYAEAAAKKKEVAPPSPPTSPAP